MPRVISLDKEFLLFRGNAVSKRRYMQSQNQQASPLFGGGAAEFTDDRVSLLRDETDLELGNLNDEAGSSSNGTRVKIPRSDPPVPSYVSQSEGFQYQMERLEAKIAKLDGLHKSRMAKPNLEEGDEEEMLLQKMTKELTQAIQQSYQQIRSIRKATQNCSGTELTLTQNLVRALSNRLQEASEKFRLSQNTYLSHIKNREEKSKRYFVDFEEEEVVIDPFSNSSRDLSGGGNNGIPGQQMSMQELLAIEENSKFVEQREAEIKGIVKSILELNTVFKELATMVSEQGTIIDRIDNNIENTHIKVEAGLEQLKKAERHQRNNWKMKCISILAVIVLILLFILIIKVS